MKGSTKSNIYRLKLKDSLVVPDFFIPDLKLIVEFDGTYYHRETPENKTREFLRDKKIIENGYTIIHISETDYKANKELVITKLFESILKLKNQK